MGDFDRNFDRRGRSRGRDSGGFDRGRSGGFGRRDRGRDRRSGRLEMHQATCDKCGKDCEVPFKPTQGKPLYCDDCFREKNREAGSGSESGKPNNENFDQINKKLDKILKILDSKELVEEQPKLKKPKKIEEVKPKEEDKPAEKPKEKPKKKAKKKKS